MLFNSLEFLLFFPLVTAIYFALPHRFRWFHLLVASCVFYMAFVPVYILILGVTIVIDYFAGILIERAQGRARKNWLIISLAANIGVLAIFKYWNFLVGNTNELAHAIGWNYSVPLLDILLPIGLSFHTFQAMSYTIEVYRGHQKAERHFGVYALYVMFYPQLVAGPIERPQNLLPQFHTAHKFDADRVFQGLARMLWGLFKKVVIADRLAVIVDQVYNQPDQYHGMALVWATWLFAIQIYCDFSGYSDIALGAAKVMGFTLMNNFDRPYFSKSIGEFWRRWHISLSTWFKDYLYVPLGGSRVQTWKWCRNLLIVFLISGLWHGANWTFIVWGALHGLYLVIGVLTTPLRRWLAEKTGAERYAKFLTPVQIFITFNLVAFAWIFFRAANMHDAMLIVSRLASGAMYAVTHLGEVAGDVKFGISPFSSKELMLAIGLAALLQLLHLLQGQKRFTEMLQARPVWVRWGAYYGMMILILCIGLFGSESFIYFQF